MVTAVLAALAALSAPAFAQEDEGERIVYWQQMTEARVPISRAGYEVLYHQLFRPGDDAGRERYDYYYDAFDGDGFLLRYQSSPAKLRMKVRDDRIEWQTSVEYDSGQQVESGIAVQYKVRQAWEQVLRGEGTRFLLSESQAFFRELDPQPLSFGGSSNLRHHADQVHRVLNAWAFPGRESMDARVPPSVSWYPAAYSYKHRHSQEFVLFDGTSVKAHLGATLTWSEQGVWAWVYEVEMEPRFEDGIDPRRLAQAVGQFLSSYGLRPEHVQNTLLDPFRYTAARLRGSRPSFTPL